MNRPRRSNSRTSQRTTGAVSSLRIIAGDWRGRRLEFPAVEGLRPTPDRVRETLFNWLMPVISGANCLDLFAGSGALGFEALSRGAAAVTFVDQSSLVKRALLDNLARLHCDRAQVHAANTLTWLHNQTAVAHSPYHVVFLDPPFHLNLIPECARLLEMQGLLAPGAIIYIEAERELIHLEVPANWRLHRHKVAGQVQYALFVRE